MREHARRSRRNEGPWSWTASTTSPASRPTRRATSISTRACSGCDWSRRRSTSTRPTSTTCTYGDERGSPGSILTFFEFPDAAPGRAGAGMIHRLIWRVASDDALAFWSERLAGEGIDVAARRVGRAIVFAGPRGTRARARGRRHRRRAAARQRDGHPARARAARVRGRARVRAGRARRRRGPAPDRRRWGSSAPRPACTSCRAAGARPTPTTTRPRRPGSRARAPCITSPGAIATTNTSSWRERVAAVRRSTRRR